MTESSDQVASVRGEFQAMVRDLECMSGTLSEIGTVWRRARPCRPDLSLGLPLQLQAVTRQLARVVDDLAWNAPSQRPDPAVLMMEQMSALETDVAAAKAMTAMCRARARVPDRYLSQGGDSAINVGNPTGQ